MTKAEEEALKVERRRQLVEWEKANDIVPGTATWKKGGGSGGQNWPGRARMAEARLAAQAEAQERLDARESALAEAKGPDAVRVATQRRDLAAKMHRSVQLTRLDEVALARDADARR